VAAVPASTETTMIDKLPTINFVKHYLDDVSLVLDDLKHQQLAQLPACADDFLRA
jgi:hypothetical protein